MKKTKTNPKALGATEKIRPMGPVLGGKEKRPSPNKFVGCSTEVDLQDKDILDELAEPIGLSKSKNVKASLQERFNRYIVRKAGFIPCYISEDGVLHMLFVKSSNAIYGGAGLQIAKGHVDGKEGFLAAALREAKEETGLRMENLDAGTVQQVWAGKLTGDIETYDFAVYAGLVHDPKNFEATDYEIAGTRWMTAEEFNQEGKPNQQNIVSVCAKKFNEN